MSCSRAGPRIYEESVPSSISPHQCHTSTRSHCRIPMRLPSIGTSFSFFAQWISGRDWSWRRTVHALKKDILGVTPMCVRHFTRRNNEPGVRNFFAACNSVLRCASFQSMPFLNPAVKKTLEIQDTYPAWTSSVLWKLQVGSKDARFKFKHKFRLREVD